MSRSGSMWVNHYTWRDGQGRVWLTIFGIRILYPGLPRKSIERWADRERGNPCRFLINARGERRFVESQFVVPPVPRNVQEVHVFLQSDIAEIAQRMGSDQPTVRLKTDKGERWLRGQFVSGPNGYVVYEPLPIHVDEDGREWLTDVQLMQALGVGRGFLLWANKESRLRPGEKALRPKEIPNPVRQKGSPGVITVYLKEDAATILEGGESKRLGVGKGANARRLRERQLKKAEQAVETILRNGRQLKVSSLFKLVKEKAGVGGTIAKRAIRQTTLERKQGRNHFRRLHPMLTGEPAADRALGNSPSEEQAQPARRKRRGRPIGSTQPEVAKRIEKMLKAWDRGDHPSKAAAGRAHGFHRSDATKLINAHEKECRK